ncbi:GRF-type domain-containing protein [Forsythia ovata]|uniref:GRF-type domain-containing protein n=1 Tax=Forsythia ovata TaxID=205694 RepID=A0ABD1XD42_9LAMI
MEDSHCSHMVKQRICHCGHAPVMKTSWTEGNPGRRFWGCRFYGKSQACNFFDWADPPPHDRYKCIINGLLRKKNEAEKEKEKIGGYEASGGEDSDQVPTRIVGTNWSIASSLVLSDRRATNLMAPSSSTLTNPRKLEGLA